MKKTLKSKNFWYGFASAAILAAIIVSALIYSDVLQTKTSIFYYDENSSYGNEGWMPIEEEIIDESYGNEGWLPVEEQPTIDGSYGNEGWQPTVDGSYGNEGW